MRAPERPQTRNERQDPDYHVCYDGNFCTAALRYRISDRWGELDRVDRMCDPLLCTELDTLGNPFQRISTTRQATGSRVLAARWTDGDVLEQEGLGEGCKRFGYHRQAREVGPEEGEDAEPQFGRDPLVLYRIAFLLGMKGAVGLQDNGPMAAESGGRHRHDLSAGGCRIDPVHNFWSSPTMPHDDFKLVFNTGHLTGDLRTKGGLLFRGCESFLCPGYDRRIEMHPSGAWMFTRTNYTYLD